MDTRSGGSGTERDGRGSGGTRARDRAQAAPGAVSPRGRATRARLLAEAQEVILASGGHLEVAAVARRAEVSAGLLYRYFGSKDGLVAAVVNTFYDGYDSEVFTTRLDTGASWPEREHDRIAREIDFLCDAPLGRMIVGRRLREPAAAHVDAERVARQIDIAARSIARGQADGELDASVDPRLAAAAVLGAFRELMAEALSGEGDPPRAAVLDAMWRVGSSLLLRPPAGPPPRYSPASDSSSSR
ncbi:TetR/AcrR family transcriptional regulator [Streptomonospora nanhaiensis]|uniref:AcrR family transcriptional regulator n=1 Tax=Streptomonospora nanhaiensis TaxID=1323731 RepID=A0A853BJ59_9ACTN|nr:TetR/AcrR family transcriptional regulator [Streptomonospora nanhaiensis]MBV2366184.1 TetR/AcrR family transcriptional regulator [Streptomonospora nanhaiensis]NYI94612.1 AcrR family transcriptional regulator [Streptomonospora nanhaiensis]